MEIDDIWDDDEDIRPFIGCEPADQANTERYFAHEFEVWQGDELVASASGPREVALREAMHYATMYGQDGPVRVFEVTRTLVAPSAD